MTTTTNTTNLKEAWELSKGFQSPNFGGRTQAEVEDYINSLPYAEALEVEGEYNLYTTRRNTTYLMSMDDYFIGKDMSQIYSQARKNDRFRLVLLGEIQGSKADALRQLSDGYNRYLIGLVAAVKRIFWLNSQVKDLGLTDAAYADTLLDEKKLTANAKRVKAMKAEELKEADLANTLTTKEVAMFISVVTDYLNICTADEEISNKIESILAEQKKLIIAA